MSATRAQPRWSIQDAIGSVEPARAERVRFEAHDEQSDEGACGAWPRHAWGSRPPSASASVSSCKQLGLLPVSAGKLRMVGELLFGSRWQSELARSLSPFRASSVSTPLNDRVVRRWAASETPVPNWVWSGVIALLERHAAEALSYARHLRLLPKDRETFLSPSTDRAPDVIRIVTAMELPHVNAAFEQASAHGDPGPLDLVLDLSKDTDDRIRSKEPVEMKVLSQTLYRGKLVYLAATDNLNGAPYFAAVHEDCPSLLEVRSRREQMNPAQPSSTR
jgi:hypothetical protein